MPMTRKANTPARKRQFKHVEESMLARGATPKKAAMAANAVLRDNPTRKKR